MATISATSDFRLLPESQATLSSLAGRGIRQAPPFALRYASVLVRNGPTGALTEGQPGALDHQHQPSARQKISIFPVLRL